ncbi:hypothetical protein X970_13840 [Pseudomonas monteilii SB3101]|uniref:Uncharacterized protein n=1 Tax=Pseudomonas monteilii SB3101 TaxID=1435058 RepID=V9VB37_9PSED|nr:hypothetical protein X969_14195 [Pseudomonas monteilii SB3078]AHC91120.1 hypothetical protein X970_13840 [Pseudomonas monteilii SB3101]KGK26049.1 hypothetical protein GT93_14890 [Pseudomonas plecoglossicida]
MELEQGVCQEHIALIFSWLQRQTKQIGEDSPAVFPETGGGLRVFVMRFSAPVRSSAARAALDLTGTDNVVPDTC